MSTDFTLWLEFELWADSEHDYSNIQVEVGSVRYAMNVWSSAFMRAALDEQSHDGALTCPDLVVSELTRPCITAVIARMLAEEGALPSRWLCSETTVPGQRA